jgi:uncharacterized membrane protein HdeD (DUF308 family)
VGPGVGTGPGAGPAVDPGPGTRPDTAAGPGSDTGSASGSSSSSSTTTGASGATGTTGGTTGTTTRTTGATGGTTGSGWGSAGPYPGRPGASALPGPLQQVARNAWQAVMLIGVAAIIFGIIALVWPHITLLVLGVLFGVYLLVSGVMQVAAAFGTHTDTSVRVLAFISGAVSIMLGLFCFRGALESILLLAIWIGIGWIFRGVSQLAAASSDPAMPARGWQIFSGIIGMIAGIVVLSSPLHSIWVLTLFGGIWLIVTGVAEIATSLRIRSHARSIPQGY